MNFFDDTTDGGESILQNNNIGSIYVLKLKFTKLETRNYCLKINKKSNISKIRCIKL